MRQSPSIHQQIDHKIRIEGSRRSNVLKLGCTNFRCSFPSLAVGPKTKTIPNREIISGLILSF